MIETQRLKIYPASKKQMENFIASQTDDELKSAYSEMLENCLKYPNEWEWYALWLIELRHNGTNIGGLCFKGVNSDGSVEIGYGISEEYQSKGYAAEAVKAVCSWAFTNPEVTSVEAEADENNEASKRVLEKCGFTLSEKSGRDGFRFVLDRKGSEV